MKKAIYANSAWCSVLALVLAAAMPGTGALGEDVTFPDASLEAKVRDRLGIPAPTPITDTDMETLGIFSADDSSISNIQGLEYGTNLTDLRLHNNQISDISAVSGLTNLYYLWLDNNRISDVSAVSGLTNLFSLGLSGNQISDISAVSELTNLNSLGLHNNQLSDISAISGLTNLQFLSLDDNQISDISAISGLTSLFNLWLDDNQISNISAISALTTNLEALILSGNQISDISAFSGMTNLYTLFLDDNQISNISTVSTLTNLASLYLHNNQISDISAVSGLTNLKYLNLSDNSISEISAFSGLTNLTRLFLSNNQVSDISAVSRLTNLNRLRLRDNQIDTLDLGGSNLASLEWFDIARNPLTNVLLADATLSQATFNTLMDGGSSSWTGIAEMPDVFTLDMSRVDFVDILDLSAMYEMDDLAELLLIGAINIDGSELSLLTGELDSLNWLDVTGPWDMFDPATQSSLNSWDAIDGNTLITPEPATLLLLGLGGLVIRRRKR